MAKITKDQVLLAIAELEVGPSGSEIYRKLCDRLGPSKWLRIAPEWRLSLIGLYDPLEALEKEGLIERQVSRVTYPSRGNRRRYYYLMTKAGRQKVNELRAAKPAKPAEDQPGMAFTVTGRLWVTGNQT